MFTILYIEIILNKEIDKNMLLYDNFLFIFCNLMYINDVCICKQKGARDRMLPEGWVRVYPLC